MRSLDERVLVALAGDSRDQKCLDGGMDGYLTKPITSAKLAETLGRMVASRRKGEMDGESDGGTEGENRDADEAGEGRDAGKAGEVLDTVLVEELRQLFDQSPPGAVGELVEEFITSAYDRLNGLADAAERNDAAALASAGHSLRGSSANFGAQRVALCCGRIEQAAKQPVPDMAGLSAMVATLRGEVDRAATALRAAFPPGGSSG